MWLRISFFADRPSFLAVVALDGNIYFKASDLGKFLCYSNIYTFAKRHSTKNLHQIIPPEFMPRYSFGSFPVMNFQDMVLTIRKTSHNHLVPFGDKLIKELQDLWNFGTVSRDMFPKLLPVSPNVAFALQVQPAGTQNMSFQEWIQKFAAMSLKMFERNKLNSNSRVVDGIKIKKEEDLDMIRKQYLNAKTSQIDQDYISTPPLSVKNTSNLDNDYFYWTPPPSVLNPSLNCNNDDNDISSPSSSGVDNYKSLPPLSVINSSDQNNEIMGEATDNKNIQPECIFQMEFEGFIGNFPEEIHINACGKKHVYVKRY